MEHFDDEFGDLSGYKILSFEEVSKGFAGNKNPLQRIAKKSLEEISFDNRLGTTEGNKKCAATRGSFYSENMDLNRLWSHLSNHTDENFFFYYQNYALVNPTVSTGISSATQMSTSNSYTPPKYFEYTKGNENTTALLTIELNKRACHISLKDAGSVFYLNPEKKQIDFHLEFVYTDYLDKRIFNTQTGRYELNKKYNAVVIKTADANGYVALSEKLRLDNDAKNEIITLFTEQVKETQDPAALKFLYESMPDFVIENLLSKLEGKFNDGVTITLNKKTGKTKVEPSAAQNLLWEHLEKLVKYDDQGAFSWTKDSSGALLNLLKVFRNSPFLFESFRSNQTMVKRIFENMNRTSVINGREWSNKTLFANFITALCIDNAFDGLRILDKEFIIGNDYAVSSGSAFQDEKDNEFYLQQLKKTVQKVTTNAHESFNEYTEVSLKEADEGNLYHPMDIVHIQYADIKESPFPFVSALSIKAFAEERDQQLRADAVRIGFDVLAIVLGIVFLPAGGAAGLAAESIGIGLALADIGIAANREDILLEPGGQEFLKTWDKVYLVGGLALAPAALVEQAFAKSVFCYLNALKKSSPLLEAYEKSLGKILLEREILTFAGNTLKPNTEISLKILAYNSDKISKATAFAFRKYDNILPLYEKGGVIVEIGEKEYALVYKSEKLIQGTSDDKKILEFYRKLKKNEKRLGEFLEEQIHEGGNSLKSIVATAETEKVKAFVALEKKYIGKTIENPFEKLKEVLPLINHELVGKAVIQIGFENCADVVDAIINFLKNKRIRKARPLGNETFEQVAAKYGGGYFQQLRPAKIENIFQTPLERLRALIKDDDIVVIYGVRDLNRITKSTRGHYFIGVKKDGVLHLFDGQSGEYLELGSTRASEYINFIRSKFNKEFKSEEGGGFRFLIVR